MGNKKAEKGSMLWRRFVKAPMRFLVKFKNFYIRSLNECSGHLDYGMAMGCPTPQISTLPRSFSTKSSNNEDFAELVRAASTRNIGDRVQPDLLRKQQVAKSLTAAPENLSRSRSVGFGKIDEDKPCEFGADINVNTDVYTRSRSYAVHKKTRFF